MGFAAGNRASVIKVLKVLAVDVPSEPGMIPAFEIIEQARSSNPIGLGKGFYMSLLVIWRYWVGSWGSSWCQPVVMCVARAALKGWAAVLMWCYQVTIRDFNCSNGGINGQLCGFCRRWSRPDTPNCR